MNQNPYLMMSLMNRPQQMGGQRQDGVSSIMNSIMPLLMATGGGGQPQQQPPAMPPPSVSMGAPLGPMAAQQMQAAPGMPVMNPAMYGKGY